MSISRDGARTVLACADARHEVRERDRARHVEAAQLREVAVLDEPSVVSAPSGITSAPRRRAMLIRADCFEGTAASRFASCSCVPRLIES